MHALDELFDAAPVFDRLCQRLKLFLGKRDADGFASDLARPLITGTSGTGPSILRVAFTNPTGVAQCLEQGLVFPEPWEGWHEKNIAYLSIGRYIYRAMTPLFPPFLKQLAPMGCRSASRTAQKLRQATLCQIEERLAGLLPAGRLRQNPSQDHSRERIFTLNRVFWCWLWQILQCNTSCREVLRQVQTLFSLQGLGIDEGTSAYCQSRAKIPLDLLRTFFLALAQAAYQRAPASSRLQGRRLKAVDGSSVRLADTKKNQKDFPQSPSQNPGAGFPVMKIVALFCVASGSLLSCMTGHLHQSEISLVAQLFCSLNPGDIVIGDRGFGNFVVAALLQKRGIDLIARVPTRIRRIDFRKAHQRLGTKEALFLWKKRPIPSPWMPRKEWLALPDSLTIRVLKIRLGLPGLRVQTLTLMTTLLDPKLYPAQQLAEAFRLRWRQEMCFDDLKTTLAMAHLKSQTPAMARKELFMFFIAHNFLRCLMAQAAAQAGLNIEQISFKGTLDGFRQCCQGMAQARSRAKRQRVWEQFKRILAADALPSRPGRREPRAVKRVTKYPKLPTHRKRFEERMSRNRRRLLARKRKLLI